MMKPIGPLMWEHRLIERAIRLIGLRSARARKEGSIDPVFVGTMVDFIRMYADRTHHGKEEEILFRDLARKSLSAEHSRIMEELIGEHRYARGVVGELVDALGKYMAGDKATLQVILSCLERLVGFYPVHIEKEDRHFFYPAMDYFTAGEQEAMLREFADFDRRMIHEKYTNLVESLEQGIFPEGLPLAAQGIQAAASMRVHVCDVCGYTYDPATGDAEGGIPAGIPFNRLPESWRCPICGASKDRFSPR